jgi:hypothetical protein
MAYGIIKHPATKQRDLNLKAIKVLIAQYLPGYEKETIVKIKKEQ